MKLKKTVISVLVISGLMLAGCGNSGPSKSEVESALNELASQFAALLGPLGASNKIQHIDVSDMKCTKVSDDIYNCAILVKINNNDVQDNYRFTKLDGKWRAEHIQ